MQVGTTQGTPLRVRGMAPKDISEGLRLCRLNGWNQLEDDWRCFLELDGGEGWLAEHEDAVVGTVAVLRYGRKFSWLSMMLVDQQQRRSGIGSHLMETALAALS